MSTLDWIIAIGTLIAALQMRDAFRWQQFTDELKGKRPKAHTFN